MNVAFRAMEYTAAGRFREEAYALEGAVDEGWTVDRAGAPTLSLGPGYLPFKTLACGICATDLSRHHLPFPLPQIIGHEVLAEGEDGARYALEINASHRALGDPSGCAYCASGLDTHCPDRLVLGIHALPGGFGPWVLAPRHAAVAVPDEIPQESAVLIEPLAAALHAVESAGLRNGDVVAVLGPRRLGMLVVAALAAYRRTRDIAFTILALSRHARLLELSRAFGADRAYPVDGEGANLPDEMAEVVFDTTGTPEGFALALRIATREVHLKSTHGRPAAGLGHLTELVVDELSLHPFPERSPEDLVVRPGPGSDRPLIAWLAEGEPPPWLSSRATILPSRPARETLAALEANGGTGLGRADAAVVSRLDQIDEVVRPWPDRQVALVGPRGAIFVASKPPSAGASSLLDALSRRGLCVTTSRCGDFRAAVDRLAADAALCTVGADLITHTFAPSRLEEAFAVARSPACVKAIVTHG